MASIREHAYHGVSTSAATAPAQHSRDSSRSTTELATRPKIRIIHIIAPEIIKTDIANFRDLVQRLTGNENSAGASSVPSPVQAEAEEKTVKKRPPPPAVEKSNDSMAWQEPASKKQRKIKCEVKVEEGGFGDYSLDCADLWMDLNPNSFLSFLEDDDVFKGLLAADHDFLQGPLGSSRHLDLVGEMYAS